MDEIQTDAERTRWQYKRLHHLFRLVAYLEWRIEQENVLIVKQALTHKRNLTRMEFSDYPAELREIVRDEVAWKFSGYVALNRVKTPQVHSAVPMWPDARYPRGSVLCQMLMRYQTGNQQVQPDYVKAVAS